MGNPSVSAQLTSSQAGLLHFIKSRIRETGVSPSYREIQAYFKYKAIGTVQDHIRALVKKGFLVWLTLALALMVVGLTLAPIQALVAA